MSAREPDLDFVAALVRLVEQSALDELVVETGELCVSIKGPKRQGSNTYGGAPSSAGNNVNSSAGNAQPAAPSPAAAQGQNSAAPSGATEVASENNVQQVVAPMTGVFYAAPAPDQPPYVSVGDTVQEGQTLCLIEAMKSFNEVTAELCGQVVEILAASQQQVSQGQPLIAVRVAGEDGAV